jgi:hypothetical protein
MIIRSISAAQKGWWSGAGSNRRPSVFQELYRVLRPKSERFLLPRSPASPLFIRHFGHSNNRAEIYRGVPFRLWDSCGIASGARSCGDSVGAPGRMRMTRPACSAPRCGAAGHWKLDDAP